MATFTIRDEDPIIDPLFAGTGTASWGILQDRLVEVASSRGDNDSWSVIARDIESNAPYQTRVIVSWNVKPYNLETYDPVTGWARKRQLMGTLTIKIEEWEVLVKDGVDHIRFRCDRSASASVPVYPSAALHCISKMKTLGYTVRTTDGTTSSSDPAFTYWHIDHVPVDGWLFSGTTTS